MKFHGVQIQEGSSISNLTVASGTAFPVTPNDAEVFFRTDSDIRVRGLYVYVSGVWDRIASADAITVPSAANFPAVANTGDLFYKDSNDANEALYVWTGSAWSPAASGSGSTATVTGDVTGTLTVGGSGALTLATVVGAATVGSAANATVITYDAKGRVTGSSTTPIAINATQVTAGSFSDARIAQSNITQYQGALSLAASQTTSGTFADAQIAASSVTQHQASLTILETQITDGALLARNAGNETITGTWQFNNALPVGTPLSSSHATTKAYVDAAINGLSWKNSVVAATTVNITLSGVQTLDGVAVTAGQRVLVKNQSSQSQNGVYVVAAGAWTRAVDFDQVTPADEVNSAAVFVQQGTLQADTAWTQTAPVVTIGSDAMVFAQFATGGLIGGTGLTLTGNQLDVVGTAGRIVANADSIDLATVTNSNTGTFLKLTTDAYGRVTGTTAVVATDITSLVSYTAGTGISVTGTTIANTGVLSIAGSTNISASAATGAVTLSLPTTLSGLVSVTSTTFVGALTGNASTASTASTASALTTGRVISATGDATGASSAFDGSAAVAIPLTLATVNASPVTASFSKVTTNAKGLVTATAPIVVADITGILSYTGDATSSGTTLTLATVNANVGQFAVSTVNAKGLVTSATNLSITGDATGTSSGAGIALSLSTVNASPVASSFVKITTTGKGLVTATTAVVNADIVSALGYTPVNKAGDTLAGVLNFGGFTASNAGAPSVGTDLTNKNYVDAAIAGLSWKTSVLVATTANITLSGTQTIDGVVLVAGNRVLVKNQTTTSANGIYVVAAGAWTRSVDSTSAAQIDGEAVYVLQGTTQADTGWTETATVSVVGTDSVTYVQFSGSGTYVAGTGISLTGNTFANTGVLSVTGSTNLSTSASAGNITLSLPTTLSGLASVSSTTFVGALSGNATTATALQTGRIISATGDATGSASAFDGTAAVAIPLTLATVNAGPVSASFSKLTTNGKGLVIATTPVVAADITSLVNATYVLKAGDTMTGTLSIAPTAASAGLFLTPVAGTSAAYVNATTTAGTLYMGLDASTGGLKGIGYAGLLWHSGAYPLRFATADTERLRIGADGNIGIGGGFVPTYLLDIQSTSGAPMALTRYGAFASSTSITMQHSRGAAVGTNTILQNNDIFGSLIFSGANGTGYDTGAMIRAEVDGVPGASADMPGRLLFLTTADNTSSPVERLRIDNAGISTFTGDAENIRQTPVTTAGFPGVRLNDTAGSRKLEMIYAGSTSGGAYGGAAGDSIINANSGNLVLSTADTGRIYITNTGFVGIGMNTPASFVPAAGGMFVNHAGTSTAPLIVGDSATPASGSGFYMRSTLEGRVSVGAGATMTFYTGGPGGTERMRIDSAGNVGIGAPPTNRLDVFHTINGIGARVRNTSTSVELAIRTDATTAGLDVGNTTGGITFSINTVEKMRMDTSGKLGIGNASPAAWLNVKQAGVATVSSGSMQLLLQDTGANNSRFGVAVTQTQSAFMTGGTTTNPPFTWLTNDGTIEQMRLDSAGNLGVGVVPSYKLDVPFATRLNSIERTAAGQLYINASDAAGFITLNTAGAERVRIDNAGNVGIATAAAISGVKLNVAGGISSAGLNVAGNGGFYNAANKFGVDNNAGQTRFYSSGPNSSTRGSYDFRITDSVGTLDMSAMQISATGAMILGNSTANPAGLIYLRGASGTRPSLVYENNGTNYWNVALKGDAGQNYYQISNSTETVGVYMTTIASGFVNLSDERFKENIEPIENAVAKVDTLRAVRFTWKADPTLPADVGVIAQDVLKVLPEAVDTSDPEKFGVRYTHMVPLLIAAIKELSATNASLLARIEALEAK